jgi:hypothetical protein
MENRMASAVIVLTVVVGMIVGFTYLLTDGARIAAQQQAEKEARMMSSRGAVQGEDDLPSLPTAPEVMAVVQLEPDVPEMPLEAPVANEVEEVVILYADFMPLEMDDLAPEEVLLNADDVRPVEDSPALTPMPAREKGLLAVQLPLPLACEIRDPQLS